MKEYNYSKIINAYNQNLINKLRDFKVNEELALWVPNEDISLSVLNLLDSVEENEINIFFDVDQFKSLNNKKLVDELKDEGKLTFDEKSCKLEFVRLSKAKKIVVEKIHKQKVSTKNKDKIKSNNKNILIHDDYLSNLKKVKISQDFSKKLLVSSSLFKVVYEDKNFLVEILINPTNHIVVDCFFENKKLNYENLLFAKFLISSMISLPINEVKDHLLIKLEYYLRPKNFEKNQGIILKNRAGKIFYNFQLIINKLFYQYIEKKNVKFGINFYNYKIPDYWSKLNHKDKIDKINELLKKFNKIKDNSISDSFELAEIVEFNRLFLKMAKNSFQNDKNFLFFELEKFLYDNLKVKFEIYYVNRQDENQLRTE